MLDLADAPYFTFLRRPYARLRSYYWYIRSNPNHYYHDALLRSGDSFAEFLRNPASPEVRNQQTRLIAGCNTAADQVDEREFAMAKDRMAAKFLAVGLQERFDESLVVLKLVLGLKDIDYVSLNRGSKSASVEEPAAAEVIRETNTYDQRLYGFAEELLDEQIARFGDRFHEELGGLHERQRSLTHRIKEELERAKQTAKYLGGRWKRKALQITQATGH